MRRKGQAAVEFLMTYGWAILAAVIAIGVLAYFGVFSPGKYVTDSAIVTAPFYVNAQNIQADVNGTSSGIVMELRNNGGENLNVTSIIVAGTTPSITCTCDASNGVGCPIVVTPSNATAFTATCAGALTNGGTYKGDITINYNKAGSTVALTSTGTIAGKITA
ncbi:MAG: hypothetical protein AABW89_00685 [Nanoarchaeota archaeon]